jgi:spore coat polysaccharide biosynthesis predicted glycosyltransferase SpsG
MKETDNCIHAGDITLIEGKVCCANCGKKLVWVSAEQAATAISKAADHTVDAADLPTFTLTEEEELRAYIDDVLGELNASKWLFTPVASLGGRYPWTLLGSAEGREAVRAAVGRIEHGIF